MLTLDRAMPRKKRPIEGRVQFRADDDFIKQVFERAAELRLNVSGYIRMVITADLKQAERERRKVNGPSKN